jgi:hypothetical protein
MIENVLGSQSAAQTSSFGQTSLNKNFVCKHFFGLYKYTVNLPRKICKRRKNCLKGTYVLSTKINRVRKLGSNDRYCFSVVVLGIIFYF